MGSDPPRGTFAHGWPYWGVDGGRRWAGAPDMRGKTMRTRKVLDPEHVINNGFASTVPAQTSSSADLSWETLQQALSDIAAERPRHGDGPVYFLVDTGDDDG